MIGPGLKKLAQQNGMSVSSGIAYGDFRGYATTFFEGSGFKRISVTTRFPDEYSVSSFIGELRRRDLKAEFQIHELTVCESRIDIEFYDSFSAMERISAFFDFFYPLLNMYGASGTGFCPECGDELLIGNCWKYVNGAAYHLHEYCADSVISSAESQKQLYHEIDEASTVNGFIGALAGALIGAIPLAILLYFSDWGALFGLLVVLLSRMGYQLFRGDKNRSIKMFTMLIASIIAVFLGNIAADFFSGFTLFNGGDFYFDHTHGLMVAFLGLFNIYVDVKNEMFLGTTKDLE